MSPTNANGLSMKGGIYSDRKCRICGGPFRDNRRDGLVCPKHPEQRATRLQVRFGRDLVRRFGRDYKAASRFLTGLRYKTDEGSFDARDYTRNNPLGFEKLADQWLEVKKREVKHKTCFPSAKFGQFVVFPKLRFLCYNREMRRL